MLYKVKQFHPEMDERWNDDTEGYPPMMPQVILLSARNSALEWIDTNAPMHFARPMFLSDAEFSALMSSHPATLAQSEKDHEATF